MAPSPSVYETVTSNIIAELDRGVVPWVRPWSASPLQLPHNASSGRHYHGVNVILLWHAAAARGYLSPAWLTFKQVKYLGGCVKKGEKATSIVYAATDHPKEDTASEDESEKRRFFLRFYSVFNVEQTEGLPERCIPVPQSKCPGERLFRTEAFVLRLGASIRHGGDHAYYAPGDDLIVLPRIEDFTSIAQYFATSLHEHVHWSGHEKRLHRDLASRFGTRAYAAEELIAELGAAFLCAKLQILGELRHASYIAHWLDLLRNDRAAIFTAAGAASKAAEYLCSLGLREAVAQGEIDEDASRIDP